VRAHFVGRRPTPPLDRQCDQRLHHRQDRCAGRIWELSHRPAAQRPFEFPKGGSAQRRQWQCLGEYKRIFQAHGVSTPW